MIFHPDLAEKVMAGAKTQTRRAYFGKHQPFPYAIGKTYAVQPGRCQKSIGRILIAMVEVVRLHDLTETDALAEGFPTIEAFFSFWEEHLRYSHHGRTHVWKVSFTLVRDES